MKLEKPESRSAAPVMVRLSKTDRKRLKTAARDKKLPMSTIAYICLKNWLDSEYGEGGAQ
jgi:hypothetical protein|nr:MAG TPA: hypothetical protein [Herelleviridae sp.]